MKNNKNYCKFVSQVKSSQVKSSQVKSSQVKSSQVKSSAKIVSLIALFILLFSISCKAKQNPKYSELEGTWKSTDIGDGYISHTSILNIDSEGNIIFNCGLGNDSIYGFYHYNFAGKLADDFEYPYTIELTFTASSLSSTSCPRRKDEFYNGKINELPIKSKIGKFTFYDASTLTALVPYLVYYQADDAPSLNMVNWEEKTLNFIR